MTAASPRRRLWWNDARWRGLLYQGGLLAAVAGLGWFLLSNTLDNLQSRHIATGFAFLGREAGFGISEHLIAYSPADSYWRALLVGLLNTLQVSLLGIVLCTLLGLVAGLARLSANPLVSRLAEVYVEAVRNIPLLLQLFFWYALITESLPPARQALRPFGDVFLSNRGLRLPVPLWDGDGRVVLSALVAGLLASLLLAVLLRFEGGRRRLEPNGRPFPLLACGLGLCLGPPLVALLAVGGLSIDRPSLQGFNFSGGLTLSPEFAALLLGLTVYTGAFVAEVVRSGIQAVPRGQSEAALALGLSRLRVLRLVLLPQALRVMVPPLTSQYLNLTKNSTLAVAIGFPDLVSVGNTAINQTGQAVESVGLVMATYLLLSLLLSALMNWYNDYLARHGGGRSA